MARLVAVLTFLTLGFLCAAGWIMNIIKIIEMANTPLMEVTAMFILRIIGIFVVPLGVVLGFF